MLSVRVKSKFFHFAEIIHLRLFGQPMSDEMRKFLGNLSWSFFGGIIAAVILFAVNIFAGRWLGPEEYGKFQTVVALSQILIIPMLMGMNTSAARYIAESSDQLQMKEAIKNTASFSVLFSSSLFFVLSWFLLLFFPVQYEIASSAIVLSIALSFLYLFRAFFQGFHRIRELSIIDAFGAFLIGVSFVVFIIFSPVEKDYRLLLYSFIIGYTIFNVVAVVRLARFSIGQFSFPVFKMLCKYGIFAIAGSIAGILLGSADRLVLAHYLGSESVGIYSAYILASTMLFSQLVQIFVSVFFPTVAALRRKDFVVKKVLRISRWSMLIAFLASVIFVPTVIIFFGEHYPIKLSYSILFSLASAFFVSYQIKMWFLNAEGIRGVRATVKGTLLFGFLGLILNIILVPLYSIYGAVIVLIVSLLLLDVYFSRKIITIYLYEGNAKY